MKTQYENPQASLFDHATTLLEFQDRRRHRVQVKLDQQNRLSTHRDGKFLRTEPEERTNSLIEAGHWQHPPHAALADVTLTPDQLRTAAQKARKLIDDHPK